MKTCPIKPFAQRSAAFTMPEIMMATAILGIVATSLYGGISSGFAAVKYNRESMRATEILIEKTEEFRTFNWDQLTNNSIPTTFSTYFYPTNIINTTNSGAVYSGTVSITNASMSEAYNSSLLLINISVSWQSGIKSHAKTMQTLVSQYGMRNYIY